VERGGTSRKRNPGVKKEPIQALEGRRTPGFIGECGRRSVAPPGLYSHNSPVSQGSALLHLGLRWRRPSGAERCSQEDSQRFATETNWVRKHPAPAGALTRFI